MTQDFSSYPDWKAPAEDSALILWPDPSQFLADTLDNHRRLAAERSCVIHGIPLSELRRRQRQSLHLTDERPVIATGHQVELMHAGVWAKLAMISAAADHLGAESLFFAVDTDAPKHLALRWPGFSQPITDDPRLTTAPWSGLLDGPTPAHLHDLKSALNAAAANWAFAPMAHQFLDYLQSRSPAAPRLADTLTDALRDLDGDLGLRHQTILASPLWATEPYAILAHHLLAHADAFADAYNQSLREYRLAKGITAPGRPMPDLQVSHEHCEVPFWIDDLATQTRQRAGVERDGDGWALRLDGDAFPLPRAADAATAAQLLDFLARHNARLSPRALTLMMVLRLLVVDQFVHGIGGGRYDQVNDRVIHRFFGIHPPAFSVTTATLYFPTAAGQSRACVACLEQEGHRLRHGVMGREKMALVKQIESLPRGSNQRQQVFSEMHNRLAAAMQTDPAIKRWEQDLAQATRQNAREQILFDRELFYAIQPRDRLRGLIEQYAARFVGAVGK